MANSTGVRRSRRGDKIRRRLALMQLKEQLEKEMNSASKAKTESTRLKHDATCADIRAALKRMRKRRR